MYWMAKHSVKRYGTLLTHIFLSNMSLHEKAVLQDKIKKKLIMHWIVTVSVKCSYRLGLSQAVL